MNIKNLATATLALTMSASSLAAYQLVPNGDFENGGDSWGFEYSNGGTVTATDAGLSQVTAGVTAIAATITAAAPAPAPTPAPVEDHQLTVIVITSAILSHPNPEMVLKVRASLYIFLDD